MPPPPLTSDPDATVACILVNWNGATHTLACLQALAQQTYRELVVVVVDNGSTDDSVSRLSAWIEISALPVHLLQTAANLGFAAGNNAGIRWASAQSPAFFWLLNNDTVPPPNTLALLLASAAATPHALVGTVLHYAHDPMRVQAWGGGHIDPNTAYATHFTAPHTFGPNDYLTFASVLLRSAILEQIGLLDERFFMYFEDAEFCLRAQHAGWAMTVAADTAVLHHEGGSGSVGRPSLAKERTTTASALLLIRLYGGHSIRGSVVFLLRRLGKRVLRGNLRAAAAIAHTAWKALPRN